MYPKVVRARGFLYFQVRRAASSAIQHALGTDFIDWQLALRDHSRHRFTCYRNTYEKLQSLYHNFVKGEGQKFGLPLNDSPSFEDFILAVCDTNDKTCDEHLVSQNWHHFIPKLSVHLSVASVTQATKLKIPFFGKPTGKLRYGYSHKMIRAMESRYAPEIFEYRWIPEYAPYEKP